MKQWNKWLASSFMIGFLSLSNLIAQGIYTDQNGQSFYSNDMESQPVNTGSTVIVPEQETVNQGFIRRPEMGSYNRGGWAEPHAYHHDWQNEHRGNWNHQGNWHHEQHWNNNRHMNENHHNWNQHDHHMNHEHEGHRR